MKLQGIDDIIEATPYFLILRRGFCIFRFQKKRGPFSVSGMQKVFLPARASQPVQPHHPTQGKLHRGLSLKKFLRRTHVVPKSVHVFIDNLRFITQTTAQSQALCQSLLQLCQELRIALNEDEMHVGSIDCVFLGVHFSHASDHFSVCLSPKFISKLQQTKDIFSPDHYVTYYNYLENFNMRTYSGPTTCRTLLRVQIPSQTSFLLPR